jgi:flagellar motor switch protein FliN
MSAGEEKDAGARAGGKRAQPILDAWAESLAQVLESMTDQRPAVEWRMRAGPVLPEESGAPLMWWEQPFKCAGPADPEEHAGIAAWVAAPRAAWEYAGTVTLKAAGLEDITETDARNTWCEILGQSLAAMARAVGAAVGHEITCGSGVEHAPDPQPPDWASVTMRFGDSAPLPLAVVLGPRLLAVLQPAAAGEEKQGLEVADRSAAAPVHAPNVDLLLDVDLPVSISFGRTQLALNDVLKLTTGSIVELNSGVNDQVEVLVNQCLVARGEVVVVEGNYGVRILEIVSRRDRLRGLR